ncbi:secretion/DNA translocation related TadE-like protein [Microbacterium sp. SORGH_AS 505]|uniref:Helicase n=1 Tax=Microbacterium oleivorans TaxID=273677 RepID=A0A4V3B3J6_9MICO|nr:MULTISPECIES: Rv3654c family TadE-like protein [Microbacterium]MDQ1126755.1 secretion/DNA translocation related TadE-like protein [Microbacterium sp. SORGH_AS_0505]TDL45113.1 helicase [Microbacterium oleivorans]
MAGTATTVGVLVVTATLAVGFVTAGAAASTAARASGAADAAALAAADTASGLVPGEPCDQAAAVAGRVGASVSACRLDGLVATVEVSIAFGAWDARARARAGPPPG